MRAAAAARLGVYLHGTAGDWASWRNGTASLAPEEIAANLGAAFRWLDGFRRTLRDAI
jgi:NAD(P)H-hydrate repair Nnr-like enzyme with NAD(P)H-hydrate dehydratase domain